MTSATDGPRSFQEILLRLQTYWAGQGCAVLQPYDMEVGAGTFHPATTLRALGPRPWSAALRAAVAAAHRRALRRQPEPAPALLPVSGGHQAIAAGLAGTSTSARSRRSGSRWGSTTSASWRTTGKVRRSGHGGSAGRSGADGMEVSQFTYFQQGRRA